MSDDAVLHDTRISLRPDPSRVVARFFVPGIEDVGPGDSRATPVIHRILALPEAEVEASAADVARRFTGRHDDFHRVIETHFAAIESRVHGVGPLSAARRYLLGACFTNEVAVESAALCNPSIVLHPDEHGATGVGDARFVLSVRGIGEGHRSTIGFREGVVDQQGRVRVESPARRLVASERQPGLHHRSSVHAHLAEVDDDRENAAFVLELLPDLFDDDALETAIAALESDRATRRELDATIAHLRAFATSAYRATFPADSPLSSRILWPHSPAEAHGMEDARFVRFVDDDGGVTYLATYTGWDGHAVSQHLLQTDDFATFELTPVTGPAATGKGLALFPRRIRGRFVALSRSDRETNAVSFSDDLRTWAHREVVQTPTRAWEVLQLGNCGSPIETDAGWLVLTHGVGPMRTYCLGATLLDLDDPTIVLGTSPVPLLSPDPPRAEGYVPHVIYTCGSMAHGDILVVPFGIGDQSIGIATASIDRLLGSLR